MENSSSHTYVPDIDEHISYISTLINQKIKNVEKKRALIEELNRIIEKNNDKLLNMSVIGDFSTGKSTFINALLRKKILKSHSLQGTTTANAVIEYGERYSITVK